MYYKYFNDDTVYNIENINDIYDIQNPQNIKILDLSNSNISHLNKDIFNNLTQLQVLKIYNNKLTELDKDIFKNLSQLEELSISNNKVTELDKNIFKNLTNLKVLNLYYNKLTELNKDIFKNLTQLHYLDISNNKVTELDKDIFKNLSQLQILYLYNNNLSEIPSSITRCRNLIYISYGGNEIEYFPPHVRRFLGNIKNHSNDIQVYNDGQNVHNHKIQECIQNSLNNILNIPKQIDKDILIHDIVAKSNLNETSIQLLLEYCADKTVHSVLSVTFEEALLHVLEFINMDKECLENKKEIYKILGQEIMDSECKCFTGRISRLVNCLNGYTSLVEIKIPETMEISNVIVMIKRSFSGETEEELKEIVRKELTERGYAEELVNEYVEYVEL
jgi:hypothetical protein